MEKFLEIYTYDENLVGKVAFPNDLEAPIRLYDFTYQSSRMEIPTLTAKLKYPECLDSKWTQREFIEFNGEKFWVAQTPSSAKDNTDGRFSHDITFISERAILSNIYFFDDVTTESNGNYGESYSSHSANVTFFGDLNEFVRRINASLSKSGVDYRVSIDVNKIINDSKISEVKEFTCDKVFVLDALKQAFEVWDIPFYFKGNNIIFADYENDITNEPLAYGIGNELLKIERNNTNKKIVTRATGVGSSENIPHYYPNETTNGNFNFYLLDKDDKEIASKVDDTLINIRFIDENKFVNNVEASIPKEGLNSFYVYEQKLTNETTIEQISNKQYTINNGQWKDYNPVAGDGIQVDEYNYATVNFAIDFKTANIGQSLKLELSLILGYYENGNFYWQQSTQGALGSAKSIELYKKYFDADTEKFQYRNIAYIGNASSVIGATQGVPNTTYNWDLGTELEAGEYRLIINEIPIEHPQYDEGLNNAGLGNFYFKFGSLFITREVEKTYSYQWVNSLDNTKRIKSLRQVGVDYVENIKTDLGKKFYYVITSKVVYQSTLMPSIFTRGEAFNEQIKSSEIGVERFYDAINGTYGDITFVNPLNAYNRSEQIYEYEDIKPTIEGVINANGEPIYKVIDVAYDADDNDYTIGEEKNDNTLENAENYAHPYFYVKLAKTDGEFGFNLFDCISEGNSMTFQIRSGNLAGCKFKVQAKEEGTNIFKNPVQVYTENAEDGSYKKGDIVLGNKDKKIDLANLQPEQQDTSANEVWIALLKEEDTFGVVMPNVENKYLMAAYDEFNIIGINLPKAYIRFAETQLDDAIVEDMRKDNEEVFNYSIDLSRIFIANDYKANGDNSWLSTLNEASYISLKYNDKVVPQYVSSYTYECKSGELLPKISIDITNHIQKEVTLVENITKSTVSTVDKNLGQRTKTIISDSKLATAKTVSTKATKSTTLSGYGIQDARIEEDGTIVLGEKSIKIGTSTQLRPLDDSITIDNSFIKVNTEDSLDSESTQRPLSAKQGKTINDLIHTMFTPHYDDYGILESVQVNAGLWSYSYISTKGISDATGGGGGGGTGFDVTRMWQELYNAPTIYSKTINKQHLPTPLSRITDNNYNEWNRVASSITTSKIDTWDSASAWVASITGSDSDTVINKWGEIVEFLNGIEETTLNSILIQKFNASNFTKSNIQSTLGISDWALASTKPSYTKSDVGLGNVSNMAATEYLTSLSSDTTNAVSITIGGTSKNISVGTMRTSLGLGSFAYKSSLAFADLTSKPTTLSGYGITDAYTKAQVNTELGKYLSLAGGKMANTNLVTNLNADLLDGVHLADVYRKSGWYRVVPYINNDGIVYHYWFKVAQINYTTTSGLAELELAAVSDANYMYSASARLTIKGYYGNPSCSVSLTSNAYLSTRINVALDKDGGVWVKSNCSWSSYLRWRAIVNDEGYTGITILDGSTKQLDQPINSCVIKENTGATYRQSKDAFETAWAAFDVGIGSFKSYSAQIKILPYNDSAYIEFGNADFTNNVPAFITGYSSNPLNLLTISSHSTIFTGSVTIGGANGVTLSFDATNDMLKFSKGGYFLGAVSTKGVSAETGTGGAGVDLSAVWDSLANNIDAYGSTKIHIDHIPTLTTSKISDFPTLVSAFANDAGFITASAIVNKADKATTLAGYGITDGVISSRATATTNLDNLVDYGIMSNASNSNATDANGYPINLAGTLFYGKTAYNRASQIYGAYNTNRWFVRTSNPSGYTSWKEIAFTTDLDTLQKKGETWANSNYYTLDVNNTSGASRCLIMLNMEGVPKATLGIEGDKAYFWNRVTGKSLEMDSTIRYNGSPLYSAVYAYDGSNYQADSITLPLALMPNVTGESGDNFKFYDTKFHERASTTSRRTQVAYGYDKDTIHFRRYNGEWTAWRTVAFTDVDALAPAGGTLTINGALKATGNSLLMGALNVNGNVNLSSMVRTLVDEGELWLGGNKIKAFAPIEMSSTLKIGDATISWDSTNQMLKIDKGIYSLGAISTKGVSNSTGETGGGVDLTTMWDSLRENNALNVIHISHIPSIPTTKIDNFASAVETLMPTNMSQLVNDAGFITASAIANKADKATTLAGYGITDAVKYCYGADDIRHSASGYAQITHGGKVNGMLLSGIYAETSLYGGQLNGAFDGSSIWYRGLNNGTFTEWKRIAFTDDVVTLNTNQTISGVKTLSANLLSATRGTLDIGDEYNSFNRIFAWHYKPNSLTKRILSSGKWYRIWNFSQGVADTSQKNAIISINKAYNYEQGQTITLAVSINNWGQTYVINQLSGTTGLITKVRVTGKWDYSYVDVYISSVENAESYSVSGYGNGERVDFEELADDATNDSTRTEELTVVNGTAVNYPLSLQNATPLVVNSTTMVANLNANYLGGLNKNSFPKAMYDYVNVSGTADTTALPTVLAPCNYNGTSVIGAGNFNFYDTKFFNGQSNTSNRCQLAYGYDHDTIAFRRYSGGEWNSWKTVAFTDVDFLTPNSGKLSIFGAMQVNSAFRALGDVDLSSMVRTNSTTGVLDLDGNYIDVYAPMNVLSTIKIGNATLSYDYASGMLLIDKGIASSGAISTKGVSNASAGIASAQFGLWYNDTWQIAQSSAIDTFGGSFTVSGGDTAVDGGTIVITSNAFSGKRPVDIEIFAIGAFESPTGSTGVVNMQLIPFKIADNKLYCRLYASGSLVNDTGFKIKVY